MILSAIFLLYSSIGYAEIQKIKLSSVISDLDQKFKDITQWVKEYIQSMKTVIDDLRTEAQQKKIKAKADESKQMMRKEMWRFKENQEGVRRQQQEARDKMNTLQMQQRLQMQSMQGVSGR